jgi:hypothetical protein
MVQNYTKNECDENFTQNECGRFLPILSSILSKLSLTEVDLAVKEALISTFFDLLKVFSYDEQLTQDFTTGLMLVADRVDNEVTLETSEDE